MFALNLQLYQIAVTGISVFMIYVGLQKYLRSGASQSFLKLLVRIIVWGGMSLVALSPSITNVVARFIGLEGNINAVILIGFLLVFLMIFKILSVVERIEVDISRLTRQEALKQISDKK